MITPEQITKKAKVIVPEHWDNNRKGKFWEQLVADLLRKQGFLVEQRLRLVGMEVDCIAYNPKTHQRAYIECKFHKKLIDSDIVDKMLGKAGRLEVNFAYLFSTSEAGSDARGVIYEEDEKNKKNPDRKPRLIFVSPEDVAQLFMDIKGIALPDLTKKNIGCVKILTLLISPEQILWVAEEIERDEPCRAIVFPTSDETKINIDELCADLSRLNLWQGLEIVEGNQVSNKADRQAASVLEIEESLELLNQFDNHLRKRRKPLERKLKRWLLDHCPGFPWLLRKVCSDIYNQILSESEIIPGRQINIKELFDKDLERYITTGEQEACLKYIAHHSPISMNEVIEGFGDNVIQCLEDNRLIIRTGLNYTIYWDIFREYIIEGKVPIIPLSYRPRNRIPTVLDIFRLIDQEEGKKLTLNELLSIEKQKKPTIQSIVLDLQNFCLVTYKHDLIEVHPKLVNAGYLEIANYLENQLEEHVVIREVYKQTQPGKLMTLWGFQKLVAKAYCIEDSQNKKTAQDYASRMLSWFLFAGLLEKQQNKLLARPLGEGKQKGKPLDCILSVSQEDTELPLLQLLG